MLFVDIVVVIVILIVTYQLEVNRPRRRKMPQVPQVNLSVKWIEFPGSPEYTETIYENQIPHMALENFTKDAKKLGDLAEYIFFQIVNGEAFVEKASVDGQIYTGSRMQGRWSKYGLLFDQALPVEVKSHLWTSNLDNNYKYKFNGKNLAGLYALDPVEARLVACKIGHVGAGTRNSIRGLRFTYRSINVNELLEERRQRNANYPDFEALVAGIRTKLNVPLEDEVLDQQNYYPKHYSRHDMSGDIEQLQKKRKK